MSRIHLHIPAPTTAEIAEANGHRVTAAMDLVEDLAAALRLFVDELDDPCRRMPLCTWDTFSHSWVQNKSTHTVHLSLTLEKAARAAIAKADRIAAAFCPTCAVTCAELHVFLAENARLRSALRALLAANTDHAAEEPNWRAAVEGARAALASEGAA